MIVDSEVPIEESLERWRCYLFGIPFSKQAREEELKKEKNGGKAQSFRRNVSREKILATLQSGGRLQEEEYLRCRVRYFCDGAALGSKDFVEQVFQDSREQFADERKSGARPLKGLELSPKPERLYNLRQLKKDVIT